MPLLLAPLFCSPAHAGYWKARSNPPVAPSTTRTPDPIYSGSATAAGGASVAAPANPPNSNGCYGGGYPGSSLTFSGTASFQWTWVPAYTGEPPPAQVILTENVTPSYMGAPSPPVLSPAPTVKYKVVGGLSGTVNESVPVSATATFTSQGSFCELLVTASASAASLLVKPGGTWDPLHGDYHVLTGQQITAAVVGIPGSTAISPGSFTVTKYVWSQPSATCFQTYNPGLPSNQLVPLGPADLTGPASGKSTSVAALYFYDRAQEDLTVACAVTMTAPDGKTVLNVTAKSPPINVLKPTASWGVDPTSAPINGTSTANIVGFIDSSASSRYFGANTTWYPVKLSVPAPFQNLGGLGCFAQITTPSATITRTPTGKGASTYSFKVPNAQGAWIAPGTGLDKSFPFPIGYTTDANGNWTGQASDSSWPVSGTGASGDYPKGQETVPDMDSGGLQWTSSSISNSFTTWLMYKPDGGVWIPVQSATWKASGNASGGPNNWSATGSYTAPAPTDAKDPPQWSVVISNQEYRP